MEGQSVKSKKRSQRDSQVKVVANWRQTEEVTVAFRRLMALLLQQKIEPKSKEEGER